MAGEVRGISTYKTYLMYRTTTSGSFVKVLDITSLSDAQRVYIPGIQDRDDMTFNANYTAANFTAVHNLEGNNYEYAVWFGATGAVGSETPTGSNGKFSWFGDIRAGVGGGGVNEAVQMTITCTPSTPLVFAAS